MATGTPGAPLCLMHTGRHYTFKEVSLWTRRETAIFLLIAALPTMLHTSLGWTWLAIPWLPIAMVGTAVAFVTGFKNNASYGRLWEARQIWGGIINSSRTWGIMAMDFPADADGPSSTRDVGGRTVSERLIHRHIAWLTALRYQLRERRGWENMRLVHNTEYQRNYRVPEWDGNLEEELRRLLDPAEADLVLSKKNRATQIIALQSHDLRELGERGALSELRLVEMEQRLAALYDDQGRCERIKNFPYPRQYATLNLFFIWLFIILVPFGLLQEFRRLGDGFVWMTIPASVIVAWVFHTMDKIGESSENPFEGSANDIPITALCRTIEIDLREMLGEKNVPEPLQPVHNILM
jgi:ion channel-forming bestrophin family protein